MLVKLLAGLLLLILLLWLFRFAMALRWQMLSRETDRASAEAAGRRVVAELPQADGAIGFFVEEGEAFCWASRRLPKADIGGLRLRLNGGVLAELARPDLPLPALSGAEEEDGQERWEVLVYGLSGTVHEIPCGSLREGISREVAHQVFSAVKRAAEATWLPARSSPPPAAGTGSGLPDAGP